MALPLPTSQIFFTFTLLPGSFVLLQTSAFSEYHPFAQSQVVSALSLTKLQQHGKSSPLLSVTHPLLVASDLPWKAFSFRKLFLQSPCPEALVCVKVYVCVCLLLLLLLCVCMCVCECGCICLLFVHLDF